jgi:non-ribosomal peptide synthetase component F
MSDFSTGYGTHSQVFHCIVKLTNVWQTGAMKHATPRYQRYRIPAAMPVWSKNSKPPFQPGNRGWITKVYASSWRTSQNKKMLITHKVTTNFLISPCTQTFRVFFAPYCRF